MKEVQAISRFKKFLQTEKGLSPNSIHSYTYDLKKFTDYLVEKDKDIMGATQDDVKQFLKFEQTKKKNSSRTLARSLAAIRQFYKFLSDIDKNITNPASAVESPHIERNLPDFLSISEVEKLFNSISELDVYELRDKTLFELLYSSGLRISEAVELENKNIDFANSFIHVIGKGDKERTVPINDETKRLLSKYLNESRKEILGKRASEYLFISKKGSKLNRKSVWRLLKTYVLRTQIEKNITPHTLRHSFATHLLVNGVDVRAVQELLGHMDISTTQVYTHLVKERMENIHKQVHPKG